MSDTITPEQRNAVLAEAAKVVEDLGGWCGGHGEPQCPSPSECARAVRAMMTPTK